MDRAKVATRIAMSTHFYEIFLSPKSQWHKALYRFSIRATSTAHPEVLSRIDEAGPTRSIKMESPDRPNNDGITCGRLAEDSS
jgi:hypothetical protein